MEPEERVKRWVQEHKILTAVIVLVVLGAGWFLSQAFVSTFTAQTTGEFGKQTETLQRESGIDTGPEPPEFKVREGDVEVDSADAEEDMETLRGKVSGMGGEVEEEQKFDSETVLRFHATVRVPADQFDSFGAWVRDTYTVESMQVRFETVSVEQQQNEIIVLQDALGVYNNLLRKLNRSTTEDISPEKIEAIATITEKKTQVARDLNRLGYNIGQVEERAAMATVRFTFSEEKPVDVAPEDFGRTVQLKVKDSMEDLADAGAELAAVPIDIVSILGRLLKWIILAIVVIFPAFLAYKYVRKGLKRVSRKVE